MAEHGAVYSHGQVMQLSAGGRSCGILQHHHWCRGYVGRSVGQGAALRTNSQVGSSLRKGVSRDYKGMWSAAVAGPAKMLQ